MLYIRLFATETAGGQEPTSELLDFALESTRPDLDLNAREICIEKLKSHPILESPSSTGSWRFRQEQVHIFFLADAICSYSVDDASKLVNRIDLGGSFAQDLGGMVVGILTNKSSQAEATPEIAKLISALTRPSKAASTGRSPGAILAAVLALRAIDHFLPRGTSERKERAELLMRLTGGGAVRNLAFAGVISGFDFRGIRFEHCCFEGVTWANCTFDGSTHFFRCQFKGGSPPANCKGFGSIHVEECQLDEIARAAINAEQIREGKKEYSLEDLRNDINSVVRKFISKGGIGLKTVHERDLIKGTISASRNRDAILDILRATILEEHVISGSGKGYHIRADAREAVKFFAANNVYSGPLREAYERLVSKIMS